MASKRRVIDIVCNYVPTKEAIADFLMLHTTKEMAPYLKRVYGPQMERMHGIQMDKLIEAKQRLPFKEFRELVEEEAQKAAIPLDEFNTMLDDAGVEKAVFLNLDEETTIGMPLLPNDYYGELVKTRPDKFIAFAGIDPNKGMDAVRELDRSVRKLGLRGVVVRPFMNEMYPNDRRYYPIYAKCIELDIPIWFHASINFSEMKTMDYGRPIYLDYVACDLPELKIIVGHAGWPWITELVALAWKHANVYIDISLMRPKYIGMHNTGWEPLVQYGNSVIQDKILFGSGWFILGHPLKSIIEEVEELPLKERVKDKWFYHNAAKLLGIE